MQQSTLLLSHRQTVKVINSIVNEKHTLVKITTWCSYKLWWG